MREQELKRHIEEYLNYKNGEKLFLIDICFTEKLPGLLYADVLFSTANKHQRIRRYSLPFKYIYDGDVFFDSSKDLQEECWEPLHNLYAWLYWREYLFVLAAYETNT